MSIDINAMTLGDVRFVERIVIGTSDPRSPQSEDEARIAIEHLNRCLNSIPRGKIIGSEKNCSLFGALDQQVIVQWTTYHVGFARKPYWLEELRTATERKINHQE